MRQAFRYRIFPTKAQRTRMERTLEYCRVLYNAGHEWKPIEPESSSSAAYGVDKDRFNVVTFKPVETNGLRLEVTMQKEWSAGVQEWRVK